MKKLSFTMVELLVVMAIIMILASLSYPVVTSMYAKANRSTAKVDISKLVFAIKNYENIYGSMPMNLADRVNVNDVDGSTIVDADSVAWRNYANSEAARNSYDKMVQMLACKDIFNTTNTKVENFYSSNKNNATLSCANPQQKHFLDVYTVENGVFNSEGFADEGLVDPWGNRYAVIFDANYDGYINFKLNGNNRQFGSSVIVYSFGPNGTDDLGEGDDIVSWSL